jgi:hypothetical protein
VNQTWYLTDDYQLTVTVTDEGIILDVFHTDPAIASEPVLTEGMTAVEWVEWMADRRGLPNPLLEP